MFSLNIFIYRFLKIFLQNALMSSSSSSLTSFLRRTAPIPVVAINVYTKGKKNDVVDVIFHESAATELSDIISDFIADRLNYLPTLFTVPQFRYVCSKVRQLSTNALVETVLTKLKYKKCQNQAQLRDLSE
jgi:hypothetical protein